MSNSNSVDKSLQRGPTDDGRELESRTSHNGDVPPLPHEADQQTGSQEETEPRKVGEQAHEDLERGLEDTDRRGDPHYREMTRSDQDSPVPPVRKAGDADPA